jgi:hypothetical protein
MIAFMDESVHTEGSGLYVIGCVIAPHVECDQLRAEFEAKARFHFHDEGEEQRIAMLRKTEGWDLATVGYFRRSLSRRAATGSPTLLEQTPLGSQQRRSGRTGDRESPDS